MKKQLILLGMILCFTFGIANFSYSQCSICKKNTQQLGEKPAKGLNAGILYLVAVPLILGGYIFYRWKKSNTGF